MGDADRALRSHPPEGVEPAAAGAVERRGTGPAPAGEPASGVAASAGFEDSRPGRGRPPGCPALLPLESEELSRAAGLHRRDVAGRVGRLFSFRQEGDRQ